MWEGVYSSEDIEKVREAADLVAIMGERSPMKQRGRDFWCCCPIHNEKTPSCKVDAANQLWHCFGCGAGGDIFGFLMKVDDMTFPESISYLAERYHVQVTPKQVKGGISVSEKVRLKEICKHTAEFYHLQLMRGKDAYAQKAREYLAQRGLGGKVPATWDLGYAPGGGQLTRRLRTMGYSDNELLAANVCANGRDGKMRDRFYQRVMFPIRDVQGDVIAFGGRVIGEGDIKYLNSNETPIFHKSSVLYGLDRAKDAMASTGTAIVVEGYTDVIHMHEAGICNAVATLGTALTRQHIRILSRHARKRIIYLFDGDAAGQHAAERALGFIDESMTPEAGGSQVGLYAVTLPDNLDPADFITGRGPQELLPYLENAQPLIEFGIERCICAYDLSRPEGRSAAAAKALSYLAPIRESLLAKDYALRIAALTGVREQDALDWLKQQKPRQSAGSKGDDGDSSGPVGQVQPYNPRAGLSAAERNRRRFERDLICLVAQNPTDAILNADAICAIHWHETLHAKLAGALFAYLCDNPSCSAAQLIGKLQDIDAKAAGLLTSSRVDGDDSIRDYLGFLLDELMLGDIEEEIAECRRGVSSFAADSPESEAAFAHAAQLQREYQEIKARHLAR